MNISDSHYKLIFDKNPLPMWIFDLETLAFLKVNDAAIIKYGYTREEFLNMTVKNIRVEGDLPALIDHLSKPSSGNFKSIWRFKKKNGSIILVEISSSDFVLNDKNARFVIVNDITEQKLNEEAVQESDMHFRMMTDSLPALIWVASIDKLSRSYRDYFNKTWLKFTGRTIVQELGNGWAEGVHPDDLERYINIYNSSFDQRKDFKMDYRLKRYDDVYRWMLDEGIPRYSISGEFLGYIGSCIDITHIKAAEEKQNLFIEREQAALKEANESNKRLEYLVKVSNILNSSLDYYKTLSSLANLITPELSDWCAIDVINEDSNLERISVSHVDPKKIEWAYEIQKKYPPDPNSGQGVYKVLKTGKSEIYPNIPFELLKQAAKDEEHLKLIVELGLKSAMVVPLISRSKILGVITFISSESGRIFNELDLKFAEVLAQRAANAVDNARLYFEAQIVNKKLDDRIKDLKSEIKERKRIEKIIIKNEKLLRISENRYRNIFETAAISIWEEDFSKVKAFIDNLKKDGIKDFRNYFEENKDSVNEAVSMVKILDVNKQSLKLFRAESKEDLMISLDKIFLPETIDIFIEELIAIAEGRNYFESETVIKTLNGEILNVLFTISFPKKYNAYNKVLISIIDITERKQAELEKERLNYALEEERNRINNLVANVPGVVWEAWGKPDDANQRINFVSDYVETLLGYSVKEWLDTPNFWLSIVHPDDKQHAANASLAKFQGKKGGASEFRWIKKNGEAIFVESQSTIICDEDGNPAGMRGVTMDITERKKAEEQIEASLREKEVLLKEIHHRVKNNLQIISSLLNLQSKYIKDEETMQIFKESQNRVKSMALIHEKLYQSEGFTKINIVEYVEELAQHLNYSFNKSGISIDLDIEDIKLNIDKVISIGLIINELMSNSLKHAFKAEKVNGKINVSLNDTNKGMLTLTVSDNGKGFPEHLDFRNTESLGLQLINSLVNQIEGKIDLQSKEGTKFIINFKK